jgi:transposase InsO family protein
MCSAPRPRERGPRQDPPAAGTASRFNGKLRNDCLNASLFLSIEDAGSKIEAWHMNYNDVRPHSSLRDRGAAEYLGRAPAGTTAVFSSRTTQPQDGTNLGIDRQ